MQPRIQSQFYEFDSDVTYNGLSSEAIEFCGHDTKGKKKEVQNFEKVFVFHFENHTLKFWLKG